jgi:hypothetical protein
MVYEGDKMVKGSDSFRVSKTQLKLAEVGHACEQSATAPKPGGSSGDLALPSQITPASMVVTVVKGRYSHRRAGARSRDKLL